MTVTTPIAYTFQSASAATGLGMTKLYELVGAGILDARKSGRRSLITADSLSRYLQNLPKAEIRAPRKRAA